MSRLDSAIKQYNQLRAAGLVTADSVSRTEMGTSTERLKNALNTTVGGGVRKPGGINVLVQPWPFYHRQAWSNSATSYDFFNVAGNNFVTNFPQAGQLPNTMAYALRTLCVHATTGFTLSTGAQDTAGAQMASTLFPLQIAEIIRIWMEQTRVEMWVGSRKIVESFVVDLPRGKGAAVGAAAATTATTTSVESGVIENGAPIDAHRDLFAQPFPIEPGESVAVKLTQPAALTLPNSAVGTISVFLRGNKIEEAK